MFLYQSVKFAHILIQKPQGVCRAGVGLVACGIVCYAFQAPGEIFDIITGDLHCFSFFVKTTPILTNRSRLIILRNIVIIADMRGDRTPHTLFRALLRRD